MRPLTQRQREALEVIAAKWRAGAVPVVHELTNELGVSADSVNDLLQPVARKGYITLRSGGRGRARIAMLTDRGKAATRMPGIPVLGCIRGGLPAEAIQNEVEEYLETIADIFPAIKPGDFALVVKGDSMAPEIQAGDRVLIRPDALPANDDIAAVYVGDDYCATLKRVRFSSDRRWVTLCPSNRVYVERTLPASQVTVVGVVKGLARNYR